MRGRSIAVEHEVRQGCGKREWAAMNWLKSIWKALTTQMAREGSGSAGASEVPLEHGRKLMARWAREPSEQPNNFTPRAQQVLALARNEADRLHHHFVGTEHLLLGLIRLNQGTAVAVVGKMGLDLESMRMEVEKQVGMGPDEKMVGYPPYTPRVKKVLALAMKEARALNHSYVGTEHILLGLLREGDGVAARVLKNLSVDAEVTRQYVLRELDPNYAIASEESRQRESSKLESDMIDTNKRYDVYCRESSGEVVYRNALFKGIKKLFAKNDYDVLAQYMEIEQADGKTIFVSRALIIRFCEPGVTPNAEGESGKKE